MSALLTETDIQAFVEEMKNSLPTPYYLIDESRLLANLKKIDYVHQTSGAKSVLALKCFSTWSVFDLMRKHMHGTTSSSLFEARLGHEKFGKEVHAYSVAYSAAEVDEVAKFATKIIFNSISQLEAFAPRVQHRPIGLRVNPGISYSHFDLADPARAHSRLGARRLEDILPVSSLLSGVMFHCNCENDNWQKLEEIIDHIGRAYAPLLEKLKWVSFGGGIYFTKDGYPIDKFCAALKNFSEKHDVQVYLEPGEAAVTQAGFFVTQVLDVTNNGIDIAIVDGTVEGHLLDNLIYRTQAKIENEPATGHKAMVAGRTCLAGDIFGTYNFVRPPKVGDLITFADAAGYTNVKKNWFNGVQMPSIVVRRVNGRADRVRQFGYEEYVSSLS